MVAEAELSLVNKLGLPTIVDSIDRSPNIKHLPEFLE
jgi:hypothetical protein